MIYALMDFSHYYDVYGPYRLTAEHLRDRTYYGREPTLAMVRRRIRDACLGLYDEVEYVLRYFCWMARRAWQALRRKMGREGRELSYDQQFLNYWEPPAPSAFQTATRSLLGFSTRLTVAAGLSVSQAAKWMRQLLSSRGHQAPEYMA